MQLFVPETFAQTPPQPVGQTGSWTVTFADEFNGSSLDTSIWATSRGPTSPGYGDPYNPSSEDQYYLANNVSVTNGNLVFTIQKQTTNGYPYSSGMVQSGRNFSFPYGYVETRIKVPGSTLGTWPAFWTVDAPVDDHWPPEIDIFEFGLTADKKRPAFNYHWGTNSNHQQSGMVNYGTTGTDYTQDYHVYGMYWDASRIQVYVDGQPGPSYTNATNITKQNQYIILNLAVLKGATPPSGTQMLVDYVRVWKKGVTTTTTPTVSPTPLPKSGDADGDGKVDGVDYLAWLNHYNQNTTNGTRDGDFNESGKVDGQDFVIWLMNYGK